VTRIQPRPSGDVRTGAPTATQCATDSLKEGRSYCWSESNLQLACAPYTRDCLAHSDWVQRELLGSPDQCRGEAGHSIP
jgi:hypothetical protein